MERRSIVIDDSEIERIMKCLKMCTSKDKRGMRSIHWDPEEKLLMATNGKRMFMWRVGDPILEELLAKGQIRKPSKPMKTTTATQLYNDGHCPHCGKRLEANACRDCGLVWTYKNGAWVEEKLATGFGKKLDELKEASNA